MQNRSCMQHDRPCPCVSWQSCFLGRYSLARFSWPQLADPVKYTHIKWAGSQPGLPIQSCLSLLPRLLPRMKILWLFLVLLPLRASVSGMQTVASATQKTARRLATLPRKLTTSTSTFGENCSPPQAERFPGFIPTSSWTPRLHDRMTVTDSHLVAVTSLVHFTSIHRF